MAPSTDGTKRHLRRLSNSITMSALRNRVSGYTNLPDEAPPLTRSRSSTISAIRNRVAGYSNLPDENTPPTSESVRTPSPTPINFDLGPKFNAKNVSAEMIKATEGESSKEKGKDVEQGKPVFEDDIERGIKRRQAEQEQIFAKWREGARKIMTNKQKEMVDEMMRGGVKEAKKK
ncbi:hypothetical protein K440DRAFT_641436 [Wilcoxina mikolae CBS 423.85]|nr:hypothetical protein K440DRAFT_641436 [Wilcoxina mikolae CBS 423.85]